VRRADWITGFTPGLAFTLESERYRLAAGYSLTAEIYARESSLNDPLSRQDFSLDGSYRVDPRLTLALTDTYLATRNTNLVSPTGVSTGRVRGWSNAVAPSATWQLSPTTTLRLPGTYTVQRYARADLAGSDTYAVGPGVEHRLTDRLTGTAAYEFAHFDIDRARAVSAHTPRLGAIYRFTETLAGSVSGGPTFSLTGGGGERVGPAASASLRQRFDWGSAGVEYDRRVGTAGALGGTTDNDTLGGLLEVTGLTKDFTLDLAPRHASARSEDGGIDVQTFSLALRSTYRITRWLSAFVRYTFYQQRSRGRAAGGGAALASDADQSLVSAGLLFGYPIEFR